MSLSWNALIKQLLFGEEWHDVPSGIDANLFNFCFYFIVILIILSWS